MPSTKKLYFLIFILLLQYTSFSESLTSRSFDLILAGINNNDTSYIIKKGFVLVSDSIEEKYKAYTFTNPETNEKIEIEYKVGTECEKTVSIIYSMKTKEAYQKLITDLNNYKAYMHKNKYYEKPLGTYAKQRITLKNNSYQIYFSHYQGKELAVVIDGKCF